MTPEIVLLTLWFPFGQPAISYSLQIAPVLAMRCNSCHGDSGGLSTRTHESLMRGGNLGPIVVPRRPQNSLILDFIEGRRGEAHRMPLGGATATP